MAGEKTPKAIGVTGNWQNLLYTPKRIGAWIKGEMTLRELHGISGWEMLEIAVSGFAMYEQGRYREARVIFEGLSSLDPRESYYRTALGSIHLAQENIDDARKEFDEAIRLNPKDLAAHVNRGEIHLRKGDVVEAAEDFRQAVALDPGNKDPMTLRARALAAATLERIGGTKVEAGTPRAKAKARERKTASKAELKRGSRKK
jgi:tetratricopeptide (TPR) repeat protein